MSRKSLSLALLLVILVAAAVNLIGALGPDLSFDALWYHLTISKLYLLAGKIYHIPGGLLYYSEMPRLIEIISLPLLKYFGQTGPHLVSFFSGLGVAVFTYLIARRYLTRTFSFLAAVLFYVTPLVGWLSTSAYIDLSRTFFEVLALLWILQKKNALAGLAMGLAISTKTLSLGTLAIMAFLVALIGRDWKEVAKFSLVSLVIGLPWYLLAYLYTSFAFYPIGAGILDSRHSSLPQILNPVSVLTDFWKLFLAPEDIISPIFLIILPFVFINWRKIISKVSHLLIYAGLGYFVYWLTPRVGGGRFFLPYLPAFAIISATVIQEIKDNLIRKVLLATVFLVAATNILYRAGSQVKLLPLLSGKETKTAYLCKNLDFQTAVLVDCDGYVSSHLTVDDNVLVAGVHNLYYINFPYVHQSWYDGQKFNYILIQGESFPQLKTSNDLIGRILQDPRWHQVYENKLTGVTLFGR